MVYISRMELFTVASCVTACFVAYCVFKATSDMVKRHLLHKRISKFGAPPSLPFVGSAHLFFRSTSEVIIDRIIELGKAYPSPFPVWIGSHLAFGISAPEHIQAICRSDKTIERTLFRDFVKLVGGTGLVTAPGTTMGVNLSEQLDSNHYTEMIEKILSTTIERIFRPWQHPDFIFYRTRRGNTHRECSKYLNDFADNVIRTRRKEHLERRGRSEAAHLHGDEKCHWKSETITLLDHLIVQSCNNGTPSDKAIRDEVNTMIMTGYDTLANSICFAMLALASNPDIQDKVYEELCEIYGEDDGEEVLVTPEDLTRMEYLERVIKEASRLFPTIPIIPRAAVEDFDIAGITVPKGSSILLGTIALHRNENYWPDPMKFDPDRFLPDEAARRHPFAYLAFGGGIRSCIGMKYALMSMKTFLATVLRRYVLLKDDIVPVEDLRYKFEILLRPSDPITLRIEKRKRNDAPS